MVDLATKYAVTNEYMDRLTAELLHNEFGMDTEQLNSMRHNKALLWTDARQKVQQALAAGLRNGTLDAAVEAGPLVIDGVMVRARP